MKKHLLAFLLLMLLPVFMAACSSADDQATENELKAKREEEAKAAGAPKKELPICPQVAIVHELDTFRDYGAEKPDPAEAVAAARMQNIDGDCAYPNDGGIDIAFDLKLVAERGPRLGGNHFEFPFFIAIVDPDGNIIDKNQLSTRFKFSDDTKEVENKTESLHVVIPLDKKDRDMGPRYRVLVGFQLTQAQLDIVHAHEAAHIRSALPQSLSPPVAETPAASDKPEAAPKSAQPETPSYPGEKGDSPYPATTNFLKPPPDAEKPAEPAPAQAAPEPLQPPVQPATDQPSPPPSDQPPPDQPQPDQPQPDQPPAAPSDQPTSSGPSSSSPASETVHLSGS